MQTIWKFGLLTTDQQVIEMPQGAKVLSLQIQYGEPTLWVLVDSDAPTEVRRFYTYGTGHPAPKAHEQEFIGTYQLANGALVFHVFVEVRK